MCSSKSIAYSHNCCVNLTKWIVSLVKNLTILGKPKLMTLLQRWNKQWLLKKKPRLISLRACTINVWKIDIIFCKLVCLSKSIAYSHNICVNLAKWMVSLVKNLTTLLKQIGPEKINDIFRRWNKQWLLKKKPHLISLRACTICHYGFVMYGN